MDKFHNTVFKLTIAKLAQNVGFDSVTSTSLEVLTTLMEKYLTLLGSRTHLASELRCTTDADITDVLFMLQSLKVDVHDLTDYMTLMEPIEPLQVAQYPAKSSINLGFTYPNNLDQTPRGPHIPMHYPPLILHSKSELENDEKKVVTNERNRRDSFVIVGKHGDDFSSDDNEYFIASNEEDESDYSPLSASEGRHLTKPEDIPLNAEGTAPSSLLIPVESEYFGETDDSVTESHSITKSKLEKKNSSKNFFTQGNLLLSPKILQPISKSVSPEITRKQETKKEQNWLLDEHKSFKSLSDTPSTKHKTNKSVKESHPSNRNPYFKNKMYESPKLNIAEERESVLKAKMEAADKLIHSPPPFLITPTPAQLEGKVPSIPKDTFKSTSIAKSNKTVSKIKTENSDFLDMDSPITSKKPDLSTDFASPKSMDDAINAVISRATEEAKKAEEEAELMKFSHLVESSSSAESEPDVSTKVEKILQLKSRGLNESKPEKILSSDDESEASFPSLQPPITLGRKEKHSPVHIYTSSSDDEDYAAAIPVRAPSPIPLPPKKNIEKRTYTKPTKKIDKLKVYESKPLFFPEDQSTIIKVKKKKSKPPSTPKEIKSISKVTLSTSSSTPKIKPIKTPKSESHHKEKIPKEPKVKSKSKEHKKHKHSSSPHIEKLVLKKFKSGSAEVVKKDDPESQISPLSRSNLPVPKLSAAVPKLSAAIPISNLTVEKEKKKSKKDKKKKLKDKYGDKHYKSFEDPAPTPKTDFVPKLTLCMGGSKKFVVKRDNSPEEQPPPVKAIKIASKTIPDVSASSSMLPPSPIKREVITQTLSSGPVLDKQGNKIWICPSCNEPDDGSPMIGCDTCDDWYHWPCVGITCEPPEDESWFCPRCTRKRNMAKSKSKQPKKKRKRTIEY